MVAVVLVLPMVVQAHKVLVVLAVAVMVLELQELGPTQPLVQ
jgi:hypothetical protein